jgi:hypothetical protein
LVFRVTSDNLWELSATGRHGGFEAAETPFGA